MEFPILVREHFKDTVERFDIETLFIIIKESSLICCPLLRWRLNVGEPHD